VEDKELFLIFMLLPALAIVGGFAVFITALIRRGQVAEFRHRERMAMIERGMQPPAELHDVAVGGRRTSSARMTLGIVIAGLGLALVMLISFAAGEPGVGIGVGGAVTMLGAAFIVSALVVKREPDTFGLPSRSRVEPPAPPGPPAA